MSVYQPPPPLPPKLSQVSFLFYIELLTLPLMTKVNTVKNCIEFRFPQLILIIIASLLYFEKALQTTLSFHYLEMLNCMSFPHPMHYDIDR